MTLRHQCGTCRWAVWTKGKSGRRNPNVAGDCTVPVEVPVLPDSIDAERFRSFLSTRYGIWAKNGAGCQRWEEKR